MKKIEKNKFSGSECEFCKESKLKVGDLSSYGASVIYSIGNENNGWFATLSPKTGGESERDFSIQLIPKLHLRNFGEINLNKDLAENYGLAFSSICSAVAKIIEKEKQSNESKSIPICTYGKCKHEDEHIHIKLFPYRGDIGQPFTIDSSYQNKERFKEKDGSEYIKMKPVTKKDLSKKRFEYLTNELLSLLK